MKKNEKRFIVIIIVISFILGFLFWNSMSLSGDWLSQDGTVSAEWYDYQGIDHSYAFSDSEEAALAFLLRNIKAEKYFHLPESNTGELSYHMNYAGTKNIGYTIRGSGWIVVFNKDFPFQHSFWKVEDGITEVIEYIVSLEQ